MLGRFVARRTATKVLLQYPKTIPLPVAAARCLGTGGVDASSHERLALEMIRYALSHARSQKSGDSYAHALLVLEQGLSNLRGVVGAGGAVDGAGSSDNAMGMLMLAMSTLHYERLLLTLLDCGV
ncbi:hypothetical protein GW17_00049242 [Ensete ventricosum]|uniref:Uncharacterized protein n=1 Tax=Ensete ventricosum TaxID=4639 RepID=A0A426YM38_ENSVE|nr:hypothetical protein B296_00025089 [Ensete ventricosum]RWV88651.1 hypothetical protein GW17_00049242 [Ensete ventricosum]RZS20475.1 hypothetical protein BHM03_00052990 [Ensete ventricosum]